MTGSGNSEKLGIVTGKGERTFGERKGTLEHDVDKLFQLPLAEFTGARNALAARLKQAGRAADASLVKTLAKPSVSAWTVNQLYWDHREAFDSLLEAGQRFHKAQTSSRAGKVTDMRESLDARREALAHLADLATSVLQDAGHNPSLETIRRVTTTLEAISANADGPTLGRLSQDVDPPGFESLASFIPGAVPIKKPVQKATALRDARELEKTRNARIAAAKVSLQTAKKSLAEAGARAQSLEAAQKQAEKQLREAEERLKKASAEVEDAKRIVEQASKELESLFRTTD